jgi:transposase
MTDLTKDQKGNKMTDLTKDQVDDIVTSDESNAIIAKRLGIHHKTVGKIRRAHNEDGTFKPDDPSTPKSSGKQWMAEHYPTTVYRDGADCVVETREIKEGPIGNDWHDTPAKCKNCDGKTHPKYVGV